MGFTIESMGLFTAVSDENVHYKGFIEAQKRFKGE